MDYELGPEVEGYYNRRPEETRLEQGVCRLEALRTKQLVEGHIPNPPLTVLDVGGGGGFYSLWLASKGYRVHLVDPVERLVEVARARSDNAVNPLESCEVGDARSIPAPDGSADVVLLLGPLYHLQEASDRSKALREAKRVLRDGGLLFAAAISRFGGVLDGVVLDLYSDPEHAVRLDESLETGKYGRPGEDIDKFTTAYFHLPEEFQTEVESAGFEVQCLEGLEGPARMLADTDEAWEDEEKRALLVRLATRLGQEPSLLGLSPHLLIVARNPVG